MGCHQSKKYIRKNIFAPNCKQLSSSNVIPQQDLDQSEILSELHEHFLAHLKRYNVQQQYVVTIDFLEARKKLRTEQEEPIPIISTDLKESSLGRRRKLYFRLRQYLKQEIENYLNVDLKLHLNEEKINQISESLIIQSKLLNRMDKQTKL